MTDMHTESLPLYETPFGTVRRSERNDGLTLCFCGRSVFCRKDNLSRFKQSVTTLACDAWRCESPCRWQLRVQTAPDQPVVVLRSCEVFKLKSLLDGAEAMLELSDILEGAHVVSSTLSPVDDTATTDGAAASEASPA